MPTENTDNEAVAERIRAGMVAFRFDRRGGISDFAAKYLLDAKKAPMVTDWRKGRYLPGPDILRAIAADWKCSVDWLRFGDGVAPSWYLSEDQDGTVPFIPREQHASGDMVALQIAVESLVAALLPKTQGAAGAFLADVKASANKRRFSLKRGFLGSLVDIALEVQTSEAKDSRDRRRADSARRTKL